MQLVETLFSTESDREPALLAYRDQPLPAFALALNTVTVIGGDVTRLAVRITAQAEIHTWAEGKNRAWLASLIDKGLTTGILRPGLWYPDLNGGPGGWSSSRWADLASFLRASHDEPVVLSYSAEEQFPSVRASDWLPPLPDGIANEDELPEAEQEAREARTDEWADLPDAEQWRLGMDWLRAAPGGLEMQPAEWADARYGPGGLSLFDLYAPDAEQRLDKALNLSR